jgi:hypothetical protein
MKATKGLWMDTRPEETPEGTYPFGKNGIQYDITSAVFNEPGFAEWILSIPGTVMGVIETDEYPIVFITTAQTDLQYFCQIGFFDTDAREYVNVVDDSQSWTSTPGSSGLGFNPANYITGQFQRNYIGQSVVTFTDKVQFPMFLNMDNPNLNSKNDLRLFPIFQAPTFTVTTEVGGSLLPGAYYVAIGYDRNDGTSTPYSTPSNVTIVPEGPIPGVGSSALLITITNADTSYDLMRVAIISKVSGVVVAVELTDYVPVTSGTVTLTYDGSNLSTVITVEEVLTPPTVYNTARAIGQLNDYLYLGGLTQEPDFDDMQQYAAQVGLQWVSQVASGTNPTADQATGKQRGLMHEETYAMYIRYEKTLGGYTKWFIVMGTAMDAASLAASTEAVAGGYPGTAPAKFQCEDTIPYFDVSGANPVGGFGRWKNQTELYPDTPYFDTTLAGGSINYRNQPVLHHRTPSLRWCKQNLYNALQDYGVGSLDLLGVQATGVRIPEKYATLISGYQIGFAIRNIANQTNYGQSVMLHGATDHYEIALPDDQAQIYTSGGNWQTNWVHGGGVQHDDNLNLRTLRLNTFRIHPFDVLFNQPAIDPTFISGQWQLQSWNTQPGLQGVMNLGDGETAKGPFIALFEYTKGITRYPVLAAVGQKLRYITKSSYLPIGINALGFVNSQHENVYAGFMAGTAWPQDTTKLFQLRNTKGSSGTPSSDIPAFEQTYLCNLIALKQDLYNTFYAQSIAAAGDVKLITDGSPFWELDSFVVAYSLHTYGRNDANDNNGAGIGGKKIVRYFVCESASNLHQRYVTTGNIYSDFYPTNSLSPYTSIAGDPTLNYPYTFDRSQDPNQFGYDKSLNAINSLVDSTIYNPFSDIQTNFPYRIHRGGVNTRTGRPRSWRTFLPLDYYEMQKNMGKIVHLEGMDDRLIIHMENSMFLTQDKTALSGGQTGIIALTVGTGDIFQYQPQEAMTAKLGYAGTLHDLACVKTPFGYVFVDAQLGEMYLYKGRLENLNMGLNTFLRDQLKQLSTNSYIGNGITIGWDQRYKRILLTVKNLQVGGYQTVIPFMNTDVFFESLVVGDIVYYQGRYIVYQGSNTTGYNCPTVPTAPGITWAAIDPFCLKDGLGNNTGLQGFTNREEFTNGVHTLTEANSTTGGVGPYFPPIENTGSCPIPAPTITWQGSGISCQAGSTPSCDAGWTLSPDDSTCTQTETTSPTITHSSYCLAPSTNGAYTDIKARIYNPGFAQTSIELDPAPSGDVYAEMTVNPFWKNAAANTTDGQMNPAACWIDSDCNGTKDPLAPGVQVTIAFQFFNSGPARTAYIGVGGDNEFTLIENGVTIAQTDGTDNILNFKIWHIFPVTWVSGENYVNLVGVGDGSVNDAIAMVVYDVSNPAIIASATDDSTLNVLFTSESLIGQHIDVATCPTGYNLDTSGGPGAYICKKVLSEAPTISPAGNTGYAVYATRCRLENAVLDGFCEPNTPTGGIGPYQAPFLDTDLCPSTNPVPDTYHIIGDIDFDCSVDDCSTPGETQITINFTANTPIPFSLWLGGTLTQSWDASIVYFGSEGSTLFTPPVGATVWSYLGTPDLAIELDVPAGVNSVSFTLPTQRDPTSGDPVLPTDWQCQPCLTPLNTIYIKMVAPTTGADIALTSDSSVVVVIVP